MMRIYHNADHQRPHVAMQHERPTWVCATSKDGILPPALSAYSCPKDHECIEIRDISTEDILIAPRRLQASDVAGVVRPPCGDFTSRAHRSRHTWLSLN